ncbi:MAG: hypothetical protein IPH06_10090 [Alphaproteobacteria bacterium]|nr:hypothetical protein [Alphaproteobacteria bacterium]QQS58338.1 MAG: hypothetical protein IPN28_05845 [Alphaproteobacteria bacterium]
MKETLPAHAFEQETGMTGISYSYVLPEDLQPENTRPESSFHSLVNVWDAAAQNRLYQMVDETLALNPGSGLERIPLDRTSPQAIQDFLHGVVSGFNADDIHYYLSLHGLLSSGNDDAGFQKIPGYKDRIAQAALEHRLGHQLGWLASPQTIDRIKQQAGLGDWTPTRGELRKAEREMFTISMPAGTSGDRSAVSGGQASSVEHDLLRLLEHYKG